MPAELRAVVSNANGGGRTEVMSSTVRALRLLELVAAEPFEWSLSDLAQALALSKATTHRILATLMEAGFISQEPIRNRYFISSKALEVGTGFLRHSPAYRAAFPVMHQLGRQVEGIVHFGVWDRDTILFLRSYGQPSSYYLYADTGDRRPLHANAMGKAMLAYSAAGQVKRVMGTKCEQFTKNTITSVAGMQRELARVRKRGYAINDEEWCLGLRAVAAPIFGQGGCVVGSICIGGPTHKMQHPKLQKYGTMVRDAGMHISSQLGFRSQIPVLMNSH